MAARVFRACKTLMAAASTEGAASSAKTKTSGNAGGGLVRPMPVSPAMRKFLGVSEASRTQVVKKIWEHIKQHDLQNPANKKEINCDEKLKLIFDGRDKVGMMEIAKLLGPHFLKTK